MQHFLRITYGPWLIIRTLVINTIFLYKPSIKNFRTVAGFEMQWLARLSYLHYLQEYKGLAALYHK